MTRSGQTSDFTIDIHAHTTANVYLSYLSLDSGVWPIVKRLDEACLGVVGDVPDLDFDAERVALTMGGCSGFIAVLHSHGDGVQRSPARVRSEIAIAIELGIPIAIVMRPGVGELVNQQELRLAGCEAICVPVDRIEGRVASADIAGDGAVTIRSLVDAFVVAVQLKGSRRRRNYAFFIGRLERDFAHAREAIRTAVESELGMACLWSDDGRHRTGVDSVRENTRLLIKHATFVIADLTLGSESPDRENPSRAHEIGMSIAYERMLMLCSQEPRRYPYFSIGDMQMSFWATEGELNALVSDWIRHRRHGLGRTMFNYRLPEVFDRYDANIRKPSFTFDPARRYIGPKTEALADV